MFTIGLIFIFIAGITIVVGPESQPLQLPPVLRGQLNLGFTQYRTYSIFLIVVGFLVAVLAAAAIPPFRSIFTDSPEMMGVVLASGAMFAVGLIDDARDMSAPAKIAGQVLAASILYFLGVTMQEFKVPLAGFYVLTPGVIPLITAAWVIALTNAVNLIDDARAPRDDGDAGIARHGPASCDRERSAAEE